MPFITTTAWPGEDIWWAVATCAYSSVFLDNFISVSLHSCGAEACSAWWTRQEAPGVAWSHMELRLSALTWQRNRIYVRDWPRPRRIEWGAAQELWFHTNNQNIHQHLSHKTNVHNSKWQVKINNITAVTKTCTGVGEKCMLYVCCHNIINNTHHPSKLNLMHTIIYNI